MTREFTNPARRSDGGRAGAVWRRNLGALWLAQFMAIFGFSFAFPFLPVFIKQDLGISGEQQVAFWAGIASSASGIALAISSPIWGLVADRYGRKAMVIRAMVGGGLLTALMGFARNVADLTALRFMQGTFSGTIAASTALVASETPRERVGWALGVMSSSVALGSAVGPLVGGLAAAAFGLRTIFVAGGILLVVATVPVFVIVRESPMKPKGEAEPHAMELLRARPGAIGAIAVVIVCQGLLQTGFSASQQLVVVRLLSLVPTRASTFTGIAFGVFGLTTTVAAVTYSRIARRVGYRRLVVAGGAAATVTIAGLAFAPNVTALVPVVAVFGLLYGVLGPATSTMLGLESPRAVQARIFGFSASATALGFGFGPLLGGGVTAISNASFGLVVAAACVLTMSMVMGLRGREPAR